MAKEPVGAPTALPPEIDAWLRGLAPEIAGALRTLLTQSQRTAATVEAMHTRLGVTEARLDDFLRGGRGERAPEPETLGDLQRRLDIVMPEPDQRLTIEEVDRLRMRMLAAMKRGRAQFERERDRIATEHRASKPQVNAWWARCQGKFRPDFVGRVIARTPHDDRVSMRNQLAELYGVSRDQILDWWKAWNGNGHGRS